MNWEYIMQTINSRMKWKPLESCRVQVKKQHLIFRRKLGSDVLLKIDHLGWQFKSTQAKLTNILFSFRSTQPKWVDPPTQRTLILMETTHQKYTLVFINLTWLLSVKMENIILRESHFLKILNIMLQESFNAQLLFIHPYCTN